MDESIDSETIADLIEEITNQPFGMPVRAMERLLAFGDGAVQEIRDALERWQDDDSRDIVWLIILLGELRSPASIPTLIQQVKRPHFDFLATAAAEALVKIGKPALPEVLRIAVDADVEVRMHAYAILGWMNDDASHSALTTALARDTDVADVIAQALSEQGRAASLPVIYEAYEVCEPRLRFALEDAMQELHQSWHLPFQWQRNWRLRYRSIPLWGGFEPTWLLVLIIRRRHRAEIPDVEAQPLRTFEEIINAPWQSNQSDEACENCGAPIEYPTGIPVCPESAAGAVLHQTRILQKYREDGLDDLFDVLDDVEDQLWYIEQAPEPKSAKERQRRQDDRDDRGIERQTCVYLIEQGVEDIGMGKSFLLAEAARLADRYGDPRGFFRPAAPSPEHKVKTGRNDPCPCGSGKKYKRCCISKAVQ
jgi:hypothetical protein